MTMEINNSGNSGSSGGSNSNSNSSNVCCIKPYVSEQLTDEGVAILRTANNNVYQYVGGFPHTTTDITAEATEGRWVVLVQGTSVNFTQSFSNQLSNTYSQAQVEDRIATVVNEYYQLLLSNADAPVNSIAETLALIDAGDQALVNSIAEKVSYTTSQLLTAQEKLTAQTNIGLENAALTNVDNFWVSGQTVRNSAPEIRLRDSNSSTSSGVSAYLRYQDSTGSTVGYIGMDSGNLKLTSVDGEIDFLKNTNFIGNINAPGQIVSAKTFIGEHLQTLRSELANSERVHLYIDSVGTANNSYSSIFWRNTQYDWKKSRIKSLRNGTTANYDLVFEASTGGSLTSEARLTGNGDFLATNFVGNWNGKTTSDFDNYQSFNLKTNGIQRTTITSGHDFDLIQGSGISISYASNGRVTISNGLSLSGYATQSWVNSQNFINLGDLAGEPISLFENNANYATESWVNGRGYLTTTDFANYARKDTSNVFTKSQTFQKTVVTGTSVTWNLQNNPELDVEIGNSAVSITITGFPSSTSTGVFTIAFNHVSAGAKTVNWDINQDFGDDGTPTISGNTGTTTIVSFRWNGSALHCLGAKGGFFTVTPLP